MKKIIVFIILFLSFKNILSQEKLQGVYYISSIINNFKLSTNFSQIIFEDSNRIDKNYFRILPIESNLYYLESISSTKRLSIINDKIKLVYKNDNESTNNSQWNIIKINNKEYLIQNNLNKKFLEFSNNQVKCSEDITDIINKENH